MRCMECQKKFELEYVLFSQECPFCGESLDMDEVFESAKRDDYLTVCNKEEDFLEYLNDVYNGDDSYLSQVCLELDCRNYDCIFNQNDPDEDLMSDLGMDAEELREFEEGYAPDSYWDD